MNLKAIWTKFWQIKVVNILKIIFKSRLKDLANVFEPNSENPHEHEVTEKDFFKTIDIVQK